MWLRRSSHLNGFLSGWIEERKLVCYLILWSTCYLSERWLVRYCGLLFVTVTEVTLLSLFELCFSYITIFLTHWKGNKLYYFLLVSWCMKIQRTLLLKAVSPFLKHIPSSSFPWKTWIMLIYLSGCQMLYIIFCCQREWKVEWLFMLKLASSNRICCKATELLLKWSYLLPCN